MPILTQGGLCIGHLHKMLRGFSVSSTRESSPADDTRIPPMVMGNKHDQQISVMGLTNRPTQLAFPEEERNKQANPIIKNLFNTLNILYSKV
jgi:hypothetical protein